MAHYYAKKSLNYDIIILDAEKSSQHELNFVGFNQV